MVTIAILFEIWEPILEFVCC